jgi:hypothetical protein
MNANYKKISGNGIVVELHQQGNVISYVMNGSGISEQVGTTRQTEADILDVLLAPMGMKAQGDKIVANA